MKKELPLQKRTIVNHSILLLKVMVLWNFDLLWENCATMEKKLWYYRNNYGAIPKTIEFDLPREKTW